MRISDSSCADCFVFFCSPYVAVRQSLICNQLVSRTLPIVKLCVIATGCQSSWNWNRIESNWVESNRYWRRCCAPAASQCVFNNQSKQRKATKGDLGVEKETKPRRSKERKGKRKNKGNYYWLALQHKWNQEKVNRRRRRARISRKDKEKFKQTTQAQLKGVTVYVCGFKLIWYLCVKVWVARWLGWLGWLCVWERATASCQSQTDWTNGVGRKTARDRRAINV